MSEVARSGPPGEGGTCSPAASGRPRFLSLTIDSWAGTLMYMAALLRRTPLLQRLQVPSAHGGQTGRKAAARGAAKERQAAGGTAGQRGTAGGAAACAQPRKGQVVHSAAGGSQPAQLTRIALGAFGVLRCQPALGRRVAAGGHALQGGVGGGGSGSLAARATASWLHN